MLNPESHARSAANNAASQARSSLQNNRTFVSTLLYLLGSMALFALVGAGATFSHWLYKTTFLLVQAAALLIGLFHLSARNWLPWYDSDNWVHGTLLTIGAWLAGMGAIALLVWLPGADTRVSPNVYLAATLPALIPYFFYESYRAWLRIPDKQYKLWYYHPNVAGPDLARMDLSNFMVMHFWMSRRFGETLFHDFSSKAPYEMYFRDLFHIFITDYNVLKPDQTIQYLDDQGQPFGWIFYIKQGWWKRRRYIDPDYSFRDNFINQGSIIVARRVAVNQASR